MLDRQGGADFEHSVGRDAELGDLELRLDLGLGKMTAHCLADVLHLRLSQAQLQSTISVPILDLLCNDLTVASVQNGNRHVCAVITKQS